MKVKKQFFKENEMLILILKGLYHLIQYDVLRNDSQRVDENFQFKYHYKSS